MWNTLFYQPIVNLLLLMYKLVGENLGLGIIAVVTLLRILLWPLTILQINSSKKMKNLQPRLQKLQEKDKSEMTMSEMKAVRDMGKGCAFGCLPTLVQLPFLISLYQALKTLASSAGTVFNSLAYTAYLTFPESYSFNTYFLGLDLALVPSEIGFKNPAVIPYLVLAVLVGASQWAATKVMGMAKDKKKDKKKSKKGKEKKDKKKDKDKTEKELQEEMMESTGNYMQIMFPAMIVFASFSVPAALSIYWLTQSLVLLTQVGIQKLWQKRKKSQKR